MLLTCESKGLMTSISHREHHLYSINTAAGSASYSPLSRYKVRLNVHIAAQCALWRLSRWEKTPNYLHVVNIDLLKYNKDR